MIAIITFLILLICFIYFFSKLGKNGIGLFEPFEFLHKEVKESFENDQTSHTQLKFLSRLKVIAIYLSFILFVIMLLSSFVPTVFTGEHLSGLFLIIHVTFAPIFALVILLLLLLYSYQLKLKNSDYQNFSNANPNNSEKQKSMVKLTFWLLAFTSIPLLLSIILILYPILGTESQNFNIIVHRVSALIFTIFVLMLIYYSFISKKNV